MTSSHTLPGGNPDALDMGAVNTVAEADTILVNRPTNVDPNTAADVQRWTYNGTRAFYVNEYSCGRARSPIANQVALRAMSHASASGTQVILEAALSDLTTRFAVDVNGDATAARDVVAGRDVLVAGNSVLPSAWTAPTFASGVISAASINDGNVANTGTPFEVGSQLVPALGRVFLRGSIFNNSGSSITAQSTLITLPVGHRPAAWVQFSGRTSTDLSTRVTVKTTGVLVINQALANQGFFPLDGLSFSIAA